MSFKLSNQKLLSIACSKRISTLRQVRLIFVPRSSGIFRHRNFQSGRTGQPRLHSLLELRIFATILIFFLCVSQSSSERLGTKCKRTKSFSFSIMEFGCIVFPQNGASKQLQKYLRVMEDIPNTETTST